MMLLVFLALLPLFVYMTMPASEQTDERRVAIADKLREAATFAGCDRPVVEFALTDPKQGYVVTVWCRDEPKGD